MARQTVLAYFSKKWVIFPSLLVTLNVNKFYCCFQPEKCILSQLFGFRHTWAPNCTLSKRIALLRTLCVVLVLGHFMNLPVSETFCIMHEPEPSGPSGIAPIPLVLEYLSPNALQLIENIFKWIDEMASCLCVQALLLCYNNTHLTCGQSYKTFHGRKLRIFVIS